MLTWQHMQHIKHDIEHARITPGSSRDRNSCISDLTDPSSGPQHPCRIWSMASHWPRATTFRTSASTIVQVQGLALAEQATAQTSHCSNKPLLKQAIGHGSNTWDDFSLKQHLFISHLLFEGIHQFLMPPTERPILWLSISSPLPDSLQTSVSICECSPASSSLMLTSSVRSAKFRRKRQPAYSFKNKNISSWFISHHRPDNVRKEDASAQKTCDLILLYSKKYDIPKNIVIS